MSRRLAGVVAVLAALAAADAAAPPVVGPMRLSAEQQREITRLNGLIDQARAAGRFADAEKTARQIVRLRQRWQGPRYWQTVDAGEYAESWRRRASVAEKDRPQLARALTLMTEAYRLLQERRHAEAERKYREATALCRQVLGEQHPDTALGWTNLGYCLMEQGKYADALPLYRRALAIEKATLGEDHPNTAHSYSNLASCLSRLGKESEALPLYRRALAGWLKALGEDHPSTARGCNSVAASLHVQGKHAEALPLYQRALAIHRKTLGEEHAATARSYSNLGNCLDDQGLHGEALPLHRRGLILRRRLLGDHDPQTAISYGNLAACLNRQGKHGEALALYQRALTIYLHAWGERHGQTAIGYDNVAATLVKLGRSAEALPVHQRALAIFLDVLGEEHPTTAVGLSNLAQCLLQQEKYAEALPLYRRALAVNRRVWGEAHPTTAVSHDNMAGCLSEQGNYAEALTAHERARAIFARAVGADHPSTATSDANLAYCLDKLGKHAAALPHHRRAVAVFGKVLGEHHPRTAASYHGLALSHHGGGDHAAAIRDWERSLLGLEFGRLLASSSGFDRAVLRADYLSPRVCLAVCLAAMDEPVRAWEHAEGDLARGLLDDLLADPAGADAGRLRRLDRLHQALLPLLTAPALDAEQKQRRESLRQQRDALLAELARDAARRARQRVLPLERIQKQIPADAAVVFWVDALEQHYGCVLRHRGAPTWVRLPGSGKAGAWTKADESLPGDTVAALATAAAPDRLLQALHRQRIEPLAPHLKGVRHLLVVAARRMAGVPVEALTERYTVSYVPSATVFARLAERHRPVAGGPLLVVADPAFERPREKPPEPPPHGLLVRAIVPGGVAARAGLRPGDVLTEYAGKALRQRDDLVEKAGDDRVAIRLWRDGRALAGRIPAGKLGVVTDRRPLPEALAEWRAERARARGSGPASYPRLPGTRLEAHSLAALVPTTTTLLGSDASEQGLRQLVASGKLKSFRLIHLATHGEAVRARPDQTALILARDRLSGPADDVLAGQKPLDGRLTVATILDHWQLDADLVVLSACETALGRSAGGEGMLGFSQALLQAGGRSVVLSLWKVDDAATALLMARFYENLLGKRRDLKQPLPRAEALREAKQWLRTLPRKDAETQLAALVNGLPRGERGTVKKGLPVRRPGATKDDDRPFAAPYYWAAFVLIGDPR